MIPVTPRYNAKCKNNIRGKELLNLRANRNNSLKIVRRDKYLLLLLLPGIVYFIIFKYLPMGGLIIAFKDYSIFKGMWESPWVGFNIFREVFSSYDFLHIIRNTLLISIYKIAFGFPIPIIISLMLNEIRSRHFKRSIQTIIYLPHFVSWVVIYGIMLTILSPSYGILGDIYQMFGKEAPHMIANSRYIRSLLVITEIWKEVGWGTILYLASLSTVDPNLYEAAVIDGANKLRQVIHITIPSIMGVVVLLLILRIGSLLSAGFEQILVIQNDLTRPVIDVFETFTFRRGIELGNYSYATAVGLFSSVVSMILVVSADRLAKSVGEEGLL